MDSNTDFDLLGAVRRRWALLAVLSALGAILGLGASTVMTPVYQGTASLLVGDFESADVSNNQIQAMQSLTATYADIARRQPVLAGAARDVGLDTDWGQLRDSVSIRVPNESPQVIEIEVEGDGRDEVKQIAGAVADRLIQFVRGTAGSQDFVSPQLREIEKLVEQEQAKLDRLVAQEVAAGDSPPPELLRQIEATQDQIATLQSNYASFTELAAASTRVTIRTLDEASAGRDPVRPDTRFNTLVGGVLGALLGAAAVYVLETRAARRRAARLPEALTPPAARSSSHTTIPINGRDSRRGHASKAAAEHREGEAL